MLLTGIAAARNYRIYSHVITFDRSLDHSCSVLSPILCFLPVDWKPQSKNKVYWEWLKGKDTPCIPFDGVPFMFIGQKVMGCHRGREKDSTKKKSYIEARAKVQKRQSSATCLQMIVRSVNKREDHMLPLGLNKIMTFCYCHHFRQPRKKWKQGKERRGREFT